MTKMTVYNVLSIVPQGKTDYVQVRTYDNPECDVISTKLCRYIFLQDDLCKEVESLQLRNWIVYGIEVRDGVLTILALPH